MIAAVWLACAPAPPQPFERHDRAFDYLPDEQARPMLAAWASDPLNPSAENLSSALTNYYFEHRLSADPSADLDLFPVWLLTKRRAEDGSLRDQLSNVVVTQRCRVASGEPPPMCWRYADPDEMALWSELRGAQHPRPAATEAR
jgi:hypothetical protein